MALGKEALIKSEMNVHAEGSRIVLRSRKTGHRLIKTFGKLTDYLQFGLIKTGFLVHDCIGDYTIIDKLINDESLTLEFCSIRY